MNELLLLGWQFIFMMLKLLKQACNNNTGSPLQAAKFEVLENIDRMKDER